MDRKQKEIKEAVDPLRVIQSLKNRVSRARSTRPLVHKLNRVSIKDLKKWELLRLGEDSWHHLTEDSFVFTSLVGKCPFVIFGAGKEFVTIKLESRPLGRGLVWHFVDLSSGALRKSLVFSNPGENNAPSVYASQYQPKAFSQLLRMEKLMLSITGDFDFGHGPARGRSKLQKLDRLQRIFRAAQLTAEAREKVVKDFPDFKETFEKARKLLKRELSKLPKGWNDFLKEPDAPEVPRKRNR